MAVGVSEARSALEEFAATWRRVVTDPHGFFDGMPETGGLQAPTLFLAICAALNGVGHLLVGWGLLGLVWVPVGEVVGAFIAAALFVLIAQHLFNGRAGFEPTYRAVAYAMAPSVIFWVPFLGMLAWLYAAYLIVRGLERVHAFDTTRAVLTLVLGIVVLWLLSAVRTRGPMWF